MSQDLSIDDIDDLKQPIYVFEDSQAIEKLFEEMVVTAENLIFDKDLKKYIERKSNADTNTEY